MSGYECRAQHPKLATCNYVIRFIDDGKRELERPTTPPALHYGAVPLPILLRKTGMIGFATLLHINKIGACAPKLATCNYVIRFIDDGKRELERPTTPPSLHYGAVPLPIRQSRTGMINFAITNNFFGRYIYGI